MSNIGEINFENIGSRRDIRVEKKDKHKYETLLKKFNMDYDRDLFVLAVKIGYFYNLDKELEKTHGKFNHPYLGNKNKAKMALIAYKKHKDSSKILDGEIILEICEKYANGGIKKLYELFCESTTLEPEIIIENFLKEIGSKID